MSSYFPLINSSNSEQNDESGCLPSFTYKERLIGFGVCFILGFKYIDKSLILLTKRDLNKCCFFWFFPSLSNWKTNKIRVILFIRKHSIIIRVNNFEKNNNNFNCLCLVQDF